MTLKCKNVEFNVIAHLFITGLLTLANNVKTLHTTIALLNSANSVLITVHLVSRIQITRLNVKVVRITGF